MCKKSIMCIKKHKAYKKSIMYKNIEHTKKYKAYKIKVCLYMQT